MWPFKNKAKPAEPLMEPKEKPPEPEKRKPPTGIKWKCPTCIKAIPERHTAVRFKCPHCRSWVYYLSDKLVTEECKESYYRERSKEWAAKFDGMTKEDIKMAREASEKELKQYATEEFVVGVEIICDSDACEVSKRFDGKKYYFKDHIPLIPLAGCTHEMSCRCNYVRLLEPL